MAVLMQQKHWVKARHDMLEKREKVRKKLKKRMESEKKVKKANGK